MSPEDKVFRGRSFRIRTCVLIYNYFRMQMGLLERMLSRK